MICGTIAGTINGTFYGTLTSTAGNSSAYWYWQGIVPHKWMNGAPAKWQTAHFVPSGGGSGALCILWEDNEPILLEDGQELEWEV